MNCYTYLIGWTNHNIWYYGSQYGKNADPKNLWESYFTSSKYVHAMKDEHGDPDVIKIRRTFGTERSACIEWERRVLRKLNAARSDSWLNKTDHVFFENTANKIVTARKNIAIANAIPLDQRHWLRDSDRCQKLSARMKDVWQQVKSGKRESLIKNRKCAGPRKGYKQTEEHKRKISQANKGNSRPHLSEYNKARSGKAHWYNDGNTNKLAITQPAGFVLGRI